MIYKVCRRWSKTLILFVFECLLLNVLILYFFVFSIYEWDASLEPTTFPFNRNFSEFSIRYTLKQEDVSEFVCLFALKLLQNGKH